MEAAKGARKRPTKTLSSLFLLILSLHSLALEMKELSVIGEEGTSGSNEKRDFFKKAKGERLHSRPEGGGGGGEGVGRMKSGNTFDFPKKMK